MVRLQRRTTFQAAGLVAFSLLASSFVFFWYYLQAISRSAPGRLSDLASAGALAEYGNVWLKVYMSAAVAGLILSAIGARGTRLRCLLALTVIAIFAPFAARLSLELLGA